MHLHCPTPHASRLWDGFPTHASGAYLFFSSLSYLHTVCAAAAACFRLLRPGEGAGDVDWDALHRLLLELQEQAKDAGTATDEGMTGLAG